ncbi:hypothetical protein EI555_004084, partial [Monodon monoceros]
GDLVKKWVDGGFTICLPILPIGHHSDKRQLDLYVNSTNQDILFRVNWVRLNQALPPSSKRIIELLYQHGFDDAIKFLLKESWFE